MNYNPKNLIENTGLKLDQKSIGSLQKEIQLLSCSDVHEFAHLFTNPESYFFRSFSHLELVKKMSTEKTSIWFAGCSTGQEVYSAALMLSSLRDKKLLGTDLSRKYIEKAISGSFFVFKKSEIKALEKYNHVSQSYLNLNNNKKSLDVKFSSIKKEGISFDILEVSMEKRKNILKLNEILALGPSISVLLEGYQDSKVTSLRGTLVPAKNLNKLISKIPVIGEIVYQKKSEKVCLELVLKLKVQREKLKPL